MKSQYACARSLPGIPIPLQGKTPGGELMERWKPDAIVVLVDVFTGRYHFDDDEIDEEGNTAKQRRDWGHKFPSSRGP